MSQVAIEISERNPNEKSKRLRRIGQVPCIIYGELLKQNIPVQLDYPKLIRLLNTHTTGSIIPLKLNEEIKNCVIKDVQRDDASGKIIHVDFQAINKNQIMKMKIPINFIGSESIHTRRLILETFLTELEMQGPAEEIPEYINIDISKMNFEDKLFARDIDLPKNIRLLTDKNSLICVINSSFNGNESEDTEAE